MFASRLCLTIYSNYEISQLFQVLRYSMWFISVRRVHRDTYWPQDLQADGIVDTICQPILPSNVSPLMIFDTIALTELLKFHIAPPMDFLKMEDQKKKHIFASAFCFWCSRFVHMVHLVHMVEFHSAVMSHDSNSNISKANWRAKKPITHTISVAVICIITIVANFRRSHDALNCFCF